MTTIFVSPAEPRHVIAHLSTVHDDTIVHSRPENHGVDFLWRARGSWFGAQRKELNDLLASMVDGRLSKELGQMAGGVERGWVIIERFPTWTIDGVLFDKRWSGREVTFSAWTNLLSSIQAAGAAVLQTADARQTVSAVLSLVAWSSKASHKTATTRPGAVGQWGTPTSREFGCHLLQSFPGVGPDVAGAIFDHFGQVPLQWTVDERALIEVPGVGKGRAQKMLRALGPAAS